MKKKLAETIGLEADLHPVKIDLNGRIVGAWKGEVRSSMHADDLALKYFQRSEKVGGWVFSYKGREKNVSKEVDPWGNVVHSIELANPEIWVLEDQLQPREMIEFLARIGFMCRWSDRSKAKVRQYLIDLLLKYTCLKPTTCGDDLIVISSLSKDNVITREFARAVMDFNEEVFNSDLSEFEREDMIRNYVETQSIAFFGE